VISCLTVQNQKLTAYMLPSDRNYESFTYNLFHFLGELGGVRVERNDALTVDQVLALEPQGIVLSRGLARPMKRASVWAARKSRRARTDPGRLPGPIRRLARPMAAKCAAPNAYAWQAQQDASHRQVRVFALPNDFHATRYHSLTIAPDSMPKTLEVTATSEDGVNPGRDAQEPSCSRACNSIPKASPRRTAMRLLANFLALTQ